MTIHERRPSHLFTATSKIPSTLPWPGQMKRIQESVPLTGALGGALPGGTEDKPPAPAAPCVPAGPVGNMAGLYAFSMFLNMDSTSSAPTTFNAALLLSSVAWLTFLPLRRPRDRNLSNIGRHQRGRPVR